MTCKHTLSSKCIRSLDTWTLNIASLANGGGLTVASDRSNANTEVDPGPNYTLGPTFNDAEILPWVIEEHVTCWYHHWTLGGSRGTHRLRNLVPQTITEVDPGPNYTLGPTFNDAEILPWVIEEHVTCWYHHWTLGGSRGTHRLRNLVPQTIPELDPGQTWPKFGPSDHHRSGSWPKLHIGPNFQ